MAGKQVDATRQELFITLEYLIDNCYDAEHTSKTIELTQYAQDKYNVLLDRRRANSILEFLADLPNSFPGILSFTVKKIDGKPRYYIENTLFSRYEIKKISEAIFKDERLSAEMAKKYVDKFLSKTCNDKDKAKLLEDFGKKEKRANHSTRKTAERIVKMDELIEEQAAFLFRPRERIKREACSNTRVSFKINSLVRRAKNPRYDEQSYIEAIGYTQAKGNDVCLYIPEYEGAIIIDINNIKIKPGSLLSYRRRGESFELADSQYSNIDEMIDLFVENRTSTIEVKPTTLYNYGNKKNYLKCLLNVKLKDFNINHYDNWKKEMNESNISTRYKNDILKFLKSVLNFAMTWYDFNLNKVYSKMTKFSNSSDIPKEMMYFTYDQ